VAAGVWPVFSGVTQKVAAMTISLVETLTQTFTITNARYLSSKVRADLLRLNRLYGQPSVDMIDKYEAELVELLRQGYLGEVTYGYQRGDNWIEPALRYTAQNLIDGTNDDPGGVPARADVSGAKFRSYLSHSPKWWAESAEARQAFGAGLPFERGTGAEPGIDGYLTPDRNYFSGGVGLGRQSVKGTK
jgi:hypothetical protein